MASRDPRIVPAPPPGESMPLVGRGPQPGLRPSATYAAEGKQRYRYDILQTADRGLIYTVHGEQGLWIMHLIMGILHSAALVALYIWSPIQMKDVQSPVFTSFPKSVTVDSRIDFVPNLNYIGNYQPHFVAPAGLFVMAWMHFVPLMVWKYYIGLLEKRRNPIRWIFLAFALPLLSIPTASLVGITDLHLLISVGLLTMMIAMSGALSEPDWKNPRTLQLQPRAFWFGLIAFLAITGLMWNYFYHLIHYSTAPSETWSAFGFLQLTYVFLLIGMALQAFEVEEFTNFTFSEIWISVIAGIQAQVVCWMIAALAYDQRVHF